MSSLALAHLTREAAAGGEDAWRTLVALLDPMLHSIARGYRLCDADAVAGWLAITARREAMRTLQRGVRELPAAEPPEPGTSEPSPDQATIARERCTELRA